VPSSPYYILLTALTHSVARPRKTKIGTEVGNVTRDLDTTFKVKRSKVTLQGRGILWRPPAQLVVFKVSKSEETRKVE